MVTAVDRPPEEAAEDTSFARGLRVFLAVADRGAVRADELSAALDTPLSTIYRYLRTLAEFGFIERAGSGYRLGPRMRITGGATVTSEELIRVADPVLGLLVQETGETAVIARRIGREAVCLHQVETRQPLRVSLAPGHALPLHAGAYARVLLAFAPPEVQDELLADVSGGRRIRRALGRVVRDGIARSEAEVFSGTVTLAVPVMRDDGIVAALAVLAPTERADLAWQARAGRLLRDAATAVSTALRDDVRP
jgi:DNA-binding IclR family transcriptional regulator